jgi:uncharacterized protein YeaO (DUF488 family)
VKIKLKRAYEPPESGDGFRVLVAVEQVVDRAHNRTAMLVYGPKDKEHNNAVALKDYLKSAGERR